MTNKTHSKLKTCPLVGYWHRLIREGPRHFADRCFLFVLRLLAAVYALALFLRRIAYRLGLVRRYTCKAFVVSVGNLTLGGTGKTSFVVALARRLMESGCRVVVLSRGYGRRGRPVERIASDGRCVLAGPEEVGDEAVLLSRQLPGVPILVGRDRVRLAARAVEEFGAEVILLDDGMQYLRLRRDVEIILVDASRPQDLRALFPAGLLREPLSELRRGDLVCLTRLNATASSRLQAVHQRIAPFVAPDRIAEATHRAAYCYCMATGEHRPAEELAHRRALLFCSIGNPQAFAATAQQVPMTVTSLIDFPDHHFFSRTELEQIRARAAEEGAEVVVTTEKDAVKLSGMEAASSFWVLGVEVEVVEGKERLERQMQNAK